MNKLPSLGVLCGSELYDSVLLFLLLLRNFTSVLFQLVYLSLFVFFPCLNLRGFWFVFQFVNKWKSKKKRKSVCVLSTCRWVGLVSWRLCGDQLILKRCDCPADVPSRGRLHKQRPLLQREAAHASSRLILLRQQQPQLSGPLHVQRGPAGVQPRLDAGAQVTLRRGQVGPQVDDEGSCGIEPLQRAFSTAQVHLLHVPLASLVHQTTAHREPFLNVRFHNGDIISQTLVVLSSDYMNHPPAFQYQLISMQRDTTIYTISNTV